MPEGGEGDDVEAFTPAERRGALVVVLLLALGAGHDAWRALQPPASDPGGPVPLGASGAAGPVDGGASGAVGSEAPPPGDAPRVDVNRASARELEALPGIGPVLAQRIVTHRGRQGPFRRVEELLAVRGIGARLLERLRPYLAVDTRSAPPRRPSADTTARAE